MKINLKSTTNRLFAVILCLLLILNIVASLNNYTVVLDITQALSVPLFFFLYFIKNKSISNIFIAFLILMFFGNLFSMLPTSILQQKIASVAYFCGYVLMITIGLYQIDRPNLKSIIGAYLAVVILLNGYFMYSFYGIMSSSISDNVELFFITMQIIALMILGFVALAGYLNKDGKQSILFLLSSFCLIFSQVLAFIEAYYISHTLFAFLNWSSYGAALVLFYNYVIDYNKTVKKLEMSKRRKDDAIEEKMAA